MNDNDRETYEINAPDKDGNNFECDMSHHDHLIRNWDPTLLPFG